MSEYLNNQLKVREEEFRSNMPADFQILQESIDYLRKNGIAGGLREGDLAPDFTLTDALGKEIQLHEVIAKGPVILTFYRGGWCPFCNIQLRTYQKFMPQFAELGASLIAISPQRPDNALSQQEKEGLDFIVASDSEDRVASQYRVLYEVTGLVKTSYEKFKLDLAELNASNRWVLPVSATFVIDKSSMIRFAHVDPNFMRGLEPERILHVLRTL